jgi:hypothetical protein
MDTSVEYLLLSRYLSSTSLQVWEEAPVNRAIQAALYSRGVGGWFRQARKCWILYSSISTGVEIHDDRSFKDAARFQELQEVAKQCQ